MYMYGLRAHLCDFLHIPFMSLISISLDKRKLYIQQTHSFISNFQTKMYVYIIFMAPLGFSTGEKKIKDLDYEHEYSFV